ncbi:MAG: ABC transporter ATP-binding protein [Clostridiales Family XIII bacterium]|jgi:tungstate transport system ATP-binding protein|nr:ABC transporter ATP-binding protein [Clostridiales Family XIII bacterium]
MKLRFENLTKIYGERTVLNIADAETPSGIITGVVGPNGAGKSTLLNIACGLDEPTAGRVLYETANGVFTDRPPMKDMTLLSQKPYLIRTTVEKNIAYPMKLRRFPRETRTGRTEKLMEAIGLTPLAKQKSWKLSGGEAQKTALARAISFRPRVLFLDEPTSGIDNRSTAEIESMLRAECRKNGTTIFIVTHDIAQVRRICDHVIFIAEGRIVEQGKAAQLLDTPREELTRRFVGGELLY